MIEISKAVLRDFEIWLNEREMSRATILKYRRDVRVMAEYVGYQIKDKADLIGFKAFLSERGLAVTSINSMLAAVNCFLKFVGRSDYAVKYLKIQRTTFINKNRELPQEEYEKLVKVARKKGKTQLAMLLQTICITGIRVSELSAITVESLQAGQATISSKGKIRTILLPGGLVKALKAYCQEQSITQGSIFVTQNGRALDRSNIWKMMKRLAQEADVILKKVFPHNLRHLFAQTYYKQFMDIVRLADILGHSSINTTRIYTMKNGSEQRMQLEAMHLLI
ncbi:MAG: tyrosine-type recombinase/integrase [Clostridia bacterium]|nr:tyrosine-type recombinase/integrase [Clostridia bacterium]